MEGWAARGRPTPGEQPASSLRDTDASREAKQSLPKLRGSAQHPSPCPLSRRRERGQGVRAQGKVCFVVRLRRTSRNDDSWEIATTRRDAGPRNAISVDASPLIAYTYCQSTAVDIIGRRTWVENKIRQCNARATRKPSRRSSTATAAAPSARRKKPRWADRPGFGLGEPLAGVRSARGFCCGTQRA